MMITEEEVRKLRESYMKAQDASDVEGCLSFWDKEGALLPPNMPMVKGIEAGRRFYEDLFKNYRQDAEVTFDEFGLSENWSFLQGRFVIKLIPVDGGETLHSKGKYLEIHKRQPDGSLKFYRHMWSEDE